MTKNGYLDFLKGKSDVDLMIQVRAIEDYIFAKKGVSVKIANPNTIRIQGVFFIESQKIITAFTHICKEVQGGRYVPN